MIIVCKTCGAQIEYRRRRKRVILVEFAAEMKNKCPNVIARGPQTGQADYWDCLDLKTQIG